MSTTPTSIATEVTEILTTGAQESVSVGIIGGADGPTAVTVTGGLDFGSIKEMMDAFDPAALLPDLAGIGDWIATLARWAVLIGPLVLLALGLAYLFLAPREANYRFGYRCYHGMGSVEAWRFTQRLAGIVFAALGLVTGVAMLLISGGFASMDTMDLLWRAVYCVAVEAGLTAVACLTINAVVALRFDGKGNERKKKAKIR